MAQLFRVSLPDGLSTVKLDSQGRGTVQYTVKNLSARAIDGRALLISLPQTKPASGAVEKGWVKIDGTSDRHFDIDKEETFTVKIAVPPNSAAGNYTFRLDTVWVNQPDQGDAGAAVAFTVAASTGKKSSFPLWLIPVILVVLIAIGVGLYFALRKGGGDKVPDLKAMTVDDATTALEPVDMTLDTKSVAGKPEDSGKILTQNPVAGATATKGGKVEVTVGAAPAAKTVSVVNVVGQTLAGAIQILSRDQLNVTPSFAGDTSKPVASQSPGAGASVPASSSVTLSFPPVVGGCAPGRLCVLNGARARMMISRARELPPQ
jgi:hypothetical protein